MTLADLRSIISSNGSIIINASKYVTSDLKTIASTASSGNAKIYIKNASRLTISDLKSIASAGKGSVVFDFTE